jgi:hypothetical protein
MKNIKYRILIGFCVFMYIYLMGSFSESTLNILKWSETTRAIVSFFGGLFAFTLPFLIPEDVFKNK